MLDNDNWERLLAVFLSVIFTLGAVAVAHFSNTQESTIKEKLFNDVLNNKTIEYRLNNKTGKVEIIEINDVVSI